MTIKALTIAGSDPSGGAGIQADLKAFSANGAYGMTVVTALTAENTQGVSGIHVVPTDFVAEQMDTLLADITPDATKIGMLVNAEIADLIGNYLPRLTNTVLDPVMVATSGDPLMDEDAIDGIRRLLPLADLITPNLHEAAMLLDEAPAKDLDELAVQAKKLVALGARQVLVKGGHMDQDATDLLAHAEGVTALVGQRIATTNTHGTGCTLSAAIAALRPQRSDWLTAVQDAKSYLSDALAAADGLGVGHGHGPVHHFVHQWS